MYRQVSMSIQVSALAALVVFLLSVSSVAAVCPPDSTYPVFVDCPEYIQDSHCDSLYYRVHAVLPWELDAAQPTMFHVYYHLVEGPGEVDSLTGLWVWHPDKPECNQIIDTVVIAASIECGETNVTPLDECCVFPVTATDSRPYFSLNGERIGSVFFVDAPGTHTFELDIQDRDQCDTGGVYIKSVQPTPAGSFVLESGQLIFTSEPADASEKFVVYFGYDYCSSTYRFPYVFDTRENPVPVFASCPDPVVMTHCKDTSILLFATNGDSGSVTGSGIVFELISGPGHVSGSNGIGHWTYMPSANDTGQVFEVEIAAVYGDLTTTGDENCRFTVEVVYEPEGIYPVDYVCGEQMELFTDSQYVLYLRAHGGDCSDLEMSIASITPEYAGFAELTIPIAHRGITHRLELIPSEADDGKVFTAVLEGTDGMETYTCEVVFRVDVYEPKPTVIRIERKEYTPLGAIVAADVIMEDIGQPLGGFNYLFTYDVGALTFMAAGLDSSELYQDCVWEYFTYRYGPSVGCYDTGCPSGLVRVVGLAETNNGDVHPSCFEPASLPSILFSLHFLVTNNDEYAGQFTPLDFYWMDCRDNTMSNVQGTMLMISSHVYDAEGTEMAAADSFPSYSGAPDSCLDMPYDDTERSLEFYSGGFGILGRDIGGRGDINLDGFGFMPDDFDLFTQFFRTGLSALPFCPGDSCEQNIGASDTNDDNVQLTIADWVFMSLVIDGLADRDDNLPNVPSANTAIVTSQAHSVGIQAADALGYVYLEFAGQATPNSANDRITLSYLYDDTLTRVVCKVDTAGLPAFTGGALIDYTGPGVLQRAQAATPIGRHVPARVETITGDEPIVVRIETTDEVPQGQFVNVDLLLDSLSEPVGAFDFLIYYDAAALTFVEAQPNASGFVVACQWEYFTYRTGPFLPCEESDCPSGKVRVVAMADINNGAGQPLCLVPPALPSPLCTIRFLVTNDREYDGAFVPVGFYWLECDDNMIMTPDLSTAYVSERVYDSEGNLLPLEDSLLTYNGMPQSCFDSTFDYGLTRNLALYGGGVQIIESKPVYERGDIDLSGSPCTISDAVMYHEYFRLGLDALPSMNRSWSVDASDANNDGEVLSIADLTYMNRVVLGDADYAVPPSTPWPDTAEVEVGTYCCLTVDFADTLKCMFFEFVGEVVPRAATSTWSVSSIYDGAITRVVVTAHNAHGAVPSEWMPLLWFNEKASLVTAQGSTWEGRHIYTTARMPTGVDPTAGEVPDHFSLDQNYPNPFNATTQISFGLPAASSVRLEVFDINGHRVKTIYNGELSAGNHILEWDGTNQQGSTAASGVYLYRLETAGTVATKKMILLK